MNGFLKFFIVFSSILLLSAILAPFLYDFLPYLGSFVSDDPEFLKFKFEKIFNRLVMIGTLVAILKFVRIRKATFEKYGLAWSRSNGEAFLRTFIISVGVLMMFVGLRIMFGTATFGPQGLAVHEWIWAVLKVVVSALLIAVIEEFFFRGFIFSTFRDRFKFNLIGALLVTNLFYASLHFVSHKKPYIGPDPQIADSFKLMAAPFMSMGDIRTIGLAAIGLFIFGVILNLLVLRTRSLYPAMGVHAGCVFFLKLDGKFVEFLHNDYVYFWGSPQIYDGVLGWGFLILLAFFSNLAVKKKEDFAEAK